MTIAELLMLAIRAIELATKLGDAGRKQTDEEETRALLESAQAVRDAFHRLYPGE